MLVVFRVQVPPSATMNWDVVKQNVDQIGAELKKIASNEPRANAV
jgi:hypothetical protein